MIDNPPGRADIINDASRTWPSRRAWPASSSTRDDPLQLLQQIVTGIKALGYTFASPASLTRLTGS